MDETIEFDPQDKSAHISSLNKTPASIIQEYAAKMRLIPVYHDMHCGISQTKVTFRYKVTLGNHEAIGDFGSSKKEAKHMAALALLTKMMEKNPQLVETDFKEWDFVNHVVSPFENNIKVNAVGQLNDICANHKLGSPDFKYIREEGQAHAKLFTYCCQVAKMIVTATHKTKKQAKHLAATQMVNKLKRIEKSLVELEPQNESDSLEVLKQVEFIKSKLTRINGPMDEDLCNYHLLFKQNEFCETIQQNILNCSNDKFDENNSRTILNKIVEECDLTLKEEFIDKNLLETTDEHIYIMHIDNVYPPIYSTGVDADRDHAKNLATIELLKNICILLKE